MQINLASVCCRCWFASAGPSPQSPIVSHSGGPRRIPNWMDQWMNLVIVEGVNGHAFPRIGRLVMEARIFESSRDGSSQSHGQTRSVHDDEMINSHLDPCMLRLAQATGAWWLRLEIRIPKISLSSANHRASFPRPLSPGGRCGVLQHGWVSRRQRHRPFLHHSSQVCKSFNLHINISRGIVSSGSSSGLLTTLFFKVCPFRCRLH